jgi:chromosome segregation protein
MYLEKLEIQGFKSFANKNKLIFSGIRADQKRGLTAIVGPNGSGKSNVADAVRWALGEQSLKTIRGKKSEDVIFSGSDKKGQLGMAEVSLYLNNSARAKSSAEFPDKVEKEEDLNQLILSCPEIVITRRIYRSGESEYLINNSRVRLADIQMMLAKANFGQKTYSVIGQGMVESFLNTSAAERKDFFDEATGVKQFQIKRDAALNRLESSYENLQQVEMLLTEIKPRLRSLTRQVDKLKKRGELAKDLRQHQLDYYAYVFQGIHKKLEANNYQSFGWEKNKLDLEKKLAQANEQLEKIKTTDNFQKINELQNALRPLEAEREQRRQQLAKLQAELELGLEAQGQFDVAWLNNKQRELEVEQQEIVISLNQLDLSSLQDKERELQQELSELASSEAAMNETRQRLRQLELDKNACQKQLAKLEAVIEAKLELRGEFDVSWLSNKEAELNKQLSQKREELLKLAEVKEDKQLVLLNEELAVVQAKLNKLNQSWQKINQELKSSQQSANRAEKLGQLIEVFLLKLKEIEAETDLFKIKQQIALAGQQFKEDSKQIIAGLDDNLANQVKEIQAEIIKNNEDKQVIQEKISEERLRQASTEERWRLLTDQESQIKLELEGIVKKLTQAQQKFTASSLNEEKAEWQEKLVELNRQQAVLEGTLNFEELALAKERLASELAKVQLANLSGQEKQRLLTDQKNNLSRELAEIKAKLSKSQSQPKLADIERERKAVSNQISSLTEQISQISAELTKLELAREQEKQQLFAYQQSAQDWQSQLNKLGGELNNLKIESTRYETRLEDLENNIRNDELSVGEVRNHQSLVENDLSLSLLQKTITQQRAQLEQIGGIDPEAENEFKETKERYDFLSTQVADLQQTIESLEEVIYKLDLNIKERFDKEFKVIAEKFDQYFKILFSGGSAKISKITLEAEGKEAEEGVLERAGENDSAEPLKKIRYLKKHNAVGLAGIDIQATPPGKKIQAVSMLSGGERALTAIALISAIISANPSPFVVLDEVDAALDEANSERLAKILDDLSNQTQFIIITHNRASMRRANILYGVTMEDSGVSKLLSVKLEETEALINQSKQA